MGYLDPDQRQPSRINLEIGAVGGVDHSQPAQPPGGHNVPSNIQSEIENHRARNQVERLVTDRPNADIDITDLRKDPVLSAGVENVMERFVRQRVPHCQLHPLQQLLYLAANLAS